MIFFYGWSHKVWIRLWWNEFWCLETMCKIWHESKNSNSDTLLVNDKWQSTKLDNFSCLGLTKKPVFAKNKIPSISHLPSGFLAYVKSVDIALSTKFFKWREYNHYLIPKKAEKFLCKSNLFCWIHSSSSKKWKIIMVFKTSYCGSKTGKFDKRKLQLISKIIKWLAC